MATREQIQSLKEKIDCRDLIKSFGIAFRGQNISCLDSSHPDNNPSMAVYQEKAYCFGCGCNLDAIGIVQKIKGISFNEAVEELSSKYGVYVESKNTPSYKTPIKKDFISNKKFIINNNKGKKFSDSNIKNLIWNIVEKLTPTNESIEWLNKRKISVDAAWKLGCRDMTPAINEISDLLEHTDFEVLKANNFINEAGNLWSPIINLIKKNNEYSGLLIPIFDLDNKVHSFRWRFFNPINRKYKEKEVILKVLGQPQCELMPAGLNFAKNMQEKNELFICEGEPDWLSLNSVFYENNIKDKFAIGLCAFSNSNWNEEWIQLLSQFKKINFSLHNTEKAKKISNMIQSEILEKCKDTNQKNYWNENIFEYFFEEKNDINDLIVKGEFNLENIQFKLKVTNTDEEDNTVELDAVSSLSLNKDWLFQKPDKEKSVLRSLTNELVIPQGDVGLFIAAGGTGKTQLLMQLTASLATGSKWLDYFVRGDAEGKVVYIFGEEGLSRIKRRFQRIFNDLNFDEKQIRMFDENVCFLSMHKIQSTFSDQDNSFQKRIFKYLNKHAGKNGWSLVILDPASRFLPKDAEVDNASATAFIRECEKLSELPGNPTILVSHHVNKSSINGAKLFSDEFDSNQAASRGASGLVDGARFVINVDNILKEDWLKTTEYRDRKLIKIRHSKINCGPFMKSINAVVDNDGVIYALDESIEEDLKLAKSRFNSDRKGAVSFKDEIRFL